jgi:hypothetical protein
LIGDKDANSVLYFWETNGTIVLSVFIREDISFCSSIQALVIIGLLVEVYEFCKRGENILLVNTSSYKVE